MFKQLPCDEKSVLAVEIVDGYKREDVDAFERAFEAQLAIAGLDKLNVLVKIDQMSLADTELKALLEDMRYALKHLQQLRHVAVVADSDLIKMIVAVDNFFLGNGTKERVEKAFSTEQIDQAWSFVRS